jgi:hypothetical protein
VGQAIRFWVISFWVFSFNFFFAFYLFSSSRNANFLSTIIDEINNNGMNEKYKTRTLRPKSTFTLVLVSIDFGLSLVYNNCTKSGEMVSTNIVEIRFCKVGLKLGIPGPHHHHTIISEKSGELEKK